MADQVSMKEYVDMRSATTKEYVDTRFASSETAVNAALAAQEKAVAAALIAQQREVAAQIGEKHDRGTSRQEIWAYIMGVVTIMSLIVTVIVVFLHR